MTESQFENLFKTHFTYLVNVANAIVKDKDEATDIAQQVFLKVWNLKDEIKIDQHIKSYLHRSVVNTSLNSLEKSKRMVSEELVTEAVFSGQQTEANSDYLSGEVELAIQKAIAALPEKCQLVFNLSRYSEMSNKEIAEHLNISIKAVEKHISKALRDLRISLKPYIHLVGVYLLLGVGLPIL
jgi:RNA polymerase sigma-70 factor (ECF subfamily)